MDFCEILFILAYAMSKLMSSAIRETTIEERHGIFCMQMPIMLLNYCLIGFYTILEKQFLLLSQLVEHTMGETKFTLISGQRWAIQLAR